MATQDPVQADFSLLEINILNAAMFEIVLLKSFAGLTNDVAEKDGSSAEAAYHSVKAYEQLALVENNGMSPLLIEKLKALGKEANTLIAMTPSQIS